MNWLINRALLLLKFISCLGIRGIPVAWKLYVGRPGKLVKVTVGGRRMLVRKRTSDVAVFRNAFIERECDLTALPQVVAIMDRYQETLARGRRPLVIDCGAHTGLSTIFLLMLFPKAVVIALEPSQDNFDLLCKNVAGCEGVTAIKAGVWDKTTHLKIVNSAAEANAYRTEECDQNEKGAIAAISIPDLFAKFGEAEPLLVKMDVEGAEKTIFQANTAWVKKTPVLIVELHDWLLPHKGTSSNFLGCVAKMGCDFVIRGENVIVINWNVGAE